MEGIKGLIESLKEFIWDVLGYFLPGIYLIILLSVIVKPEYFLKSPLLAEKDEGINLIIVIISYILGYVIYGVGEIKENWLRDKSFREKVQRRIAGSSNYKMASELLQKKLDTAIIPTQIANLNMKEVRNLAMSYVLESDKKVYTFMFRSDVARHIANSSLITGTVCVLAGIVQLRFLKFNVVHFDGLHVILYLFLIGVFFVLNATRNRFYEMAMSIPFSIFISFYNK
ncbi:hypothetical protein EON73_00345 [bacterium]|nr:MAG: hypothetical protein EON73_00345 [bacterium]